jgi:phage-related baseplate assembly protein
MTQDLSKIPAPNIIEPLSYELILSRMQEELVAKDPEFSALVESDPAIKVLEIAAWRELLLRQRINDAARANLLAFALDSDLDHLAAFYNVERTEAESDLAFRKRTQAKIAGWSTAGSRDYYRYHALSASTRVLDARADSPLPGQVRISILAADNQGIADDALLNGVTEAVTNDTVRVLTDSVEVVACGIKTTPIIADIYLYPETNAEIIIQAKTRLNNAIAEQKRLGWDLTRSWVMGNLFVEGMQKIEIISPAQDIEIAENECVAIDSVQLTLKDRRW